MATIKGTQELVYDYLYKGRENAITAIELSKILDCDPRDISRAVERERCKGYPIAATCTGGTMGYYIPINKADMLDYCRRLENRVRHISNTLRVCKKAATKL